MASDLRNLNPPSGWRLSTIAASCVIRNDLRRPLSVEERSGIQGEFPYYGPTGILDWINEYRVEGQYALLSEDGDHFLKYAEVPMTLLVDGKFNVNNHAHLVAGAGDCLTKWIYYFYNHTNLGPFITRQGVGRYKLTKEALKRLPLLVPPPDEQSAIVGVLETSDRGIGQLEGLIAAKERRKRGLMQQLLTGKRRFPEFVILKERRNTLLGEVAADWPTRPIEDIFKRVRRKNGNTTDLVLTASGQHGLVDQRTYFDRNVAGESLEGYYLLGRGEYAYNRSSMNGYPHGAIKRLDVHNHGAVSTLYHCFALVDEGCDSDFFMHLFEFGLLNRQLSRICKVGGRAHGLLNVTAGDFEKMVVPVPEKDEQMSISSVLNACDHELQQLRTQLAALKQQKKGLMQKLLTGEVRITLKTGNKG